MNLDFARSERRSTNEKRRRTTALGLVVALVAGVLALVGVLAAAPAPVAAYGDSGTSIISVGTVHTCGIASGAAKCWGENANGQLGDGSTTASAVPVQVQGLTSGVTAISASATQTCAVVSGAAKCWGLNTNGQLGNNSTTASSVPVQVQGLTSGVTAISTGTSHTCAIVSGAAKCWGLNTNGRLGNSSTTQSLVPVQVTGLTSGVTAISAGASHTCAVVSGAAKCWGLSTNGQVGNSSTLGSTSPVQVTGLTSGVTTISAGASHSCAVASGGVKCWGLGTTGRLGNGADTQQTFPVQVQGLTTGATAVSAGFNGSCAIVSGAAWCWGRTTMLATGSGGTSSNVPVMIAGLTTGVAAISYGSTHACAVVGTTAKCWGSNTNGHLGNGLTTTSLVPAQVSGLTSGISAVAVNRPAASSGVACALTSSGGVMCWGANTEGTLGNGTQVSSGVPVQVTGFTAGVTEISVGNFHACAVVSGGAQCWGNNGAGAMGGLATNQRYTVPTALPGFESGVTSISAGNQFTCLVKSGAAYCSGNGGSGTLGNGAGQSSSTFVPVSGLGSGVTAVSTAISHACALQSGTVKCWGTNSAGLGNGSTTSNVPVTVTGLTGVTAISAGEYTSCATNASGTWCWGSNAAGGFGDGSTTSSPTPVLTGFGAGATALSAAPVTCAIVSGGAQCAGSNAEGALGNGTTGNSSTPVTPTGLTSGVTSIATNSEWTCAAVSGAAKCWGDDSDGQLGRLDTLRPGDVAGGYSWGASSNKVPVATPQSVYAVPGTAKAITLAGTDEDSDPLTFSVTANPAKGSVSCTSAGACTYTATAGESGSDSFQFTANDGQATSAAATISLSLSPPAAPTISGTRSPAANPNGWNNEPVTVSFTCGSEALASCTAPVTVSTDGSGQSASGTATDEYGQTASTTVTGISIDRVAPTLAGLATTSPNAAGWYRAPVTMAWTCDDDRSGITSGVCQSANTTVGEGSAVSTSASVNDRAGNVTTASSEAVKVDLTAPSTGVSSPPTWSKTDVTLTLTATDALSGVATTQYRVDGGADQTGTRPVVSGQGHHVVTFWSVDAAGNEETHGSVGVDIDTTAPSITPHVSPAPNSNGWNRTNVDVTFTCTDAGGSDVGTCTGDRSLTTETTTVVTGTAADNAGNTASAQATVRIDKTAPTATAQVPPASANGWFNASVQVPVSCVDTGGSGIDTCTDPVLLAGEGADQPVIGTAVDLAGNTGTTSNAGKVSIDLTAPTISGAVLEPIGSNGSYAGTVHVRWTCTDALSGVSACPADQTVSGEGIHTVTGSVNDKAGNSATAEVTFRLDRDTSNDPGSVRGTVTDVVTGQPAPGVTMALYNASTLALVAQTTTGTDGRYQLAALPNGTYKLSATKWSTYLQSWYTTTGSGSSPITVTIGSNQVFNLSMSPGHVLKGTVTTTTGAPISGATVLLSNGVQTRTDATGAYEIKGPSSGTYGIQYIAMGYVGTTGSATFTGSTSTTVTVDKQLAAQPTSTGMKGTITSYRTGAPLAGATVRIWAKNGMTFSLTVQTNSLGRYELPTLPAGDYQVDVVRGDYYVRWAADAADRPGAATYTLTTSCTTTPDGSWGNACSTPVNIAMRQP